MTMTNYGLSKLVEEAGEVLQIAGKMLQYPDQEQHPDGLGPMRERLVDELADLAAAAQFVMNKLQLDADRFNERAEEKSQLFASWDEDDR